MKGMTTNLKKVP